MNPAPDSSANGAPPPLLAALRDSEARIRSSFEAMEEGLVLQQRDGRIIDANRAAEAILGLSRDQLLGKSSMDPNWHAVLEDGSPFSGERHPSMVALRTNKVVRDQVMGIRSPTVGLRWLSVNAVPIAGPDNGAAEAVVATFVDITERRRLHARLAEVIDELSDLYENAPCGYHSLDPEGRILRMNATELAWLGRNRVEVVGKKFITDFLTPEGCETFRVQFPRLLRDGRVDDLELDLVGAAGSTRRVSISATAIRNPEGRLLSTRSVAYDITPLKRAQDARLEAARLEAENAHMREASRLKSLFMADMSHELRTPLNAVIGLTQLLQTEAEPADASRRQAYLGQIGSSARHLLRLIDEVLDFAALEAGRIRFEPAAVQLKALVQDVTAALAADVQARQQTVCSHVDDTLGEVMVDALRLKQVLSIFLSNALKFSPEGGRVDVRLLADGPERFRLEVEDSGIGIAQADLPMLFTKFQQLSVGVTKAYPGIGLGLALTREVVEAQGGSVGVSSRAGHGSVFHAVLPRVWRAVDPGPEAGTG